MKKLKIIKFNEIDSTNLEAHRLANKNIDNTLIIAEHQTAGRGRGEKSFFSPQGTGIYFTLLLPNPKDFSIVTIKVAVAVAEAIKFYAKKEVTIKWVNDIFMGDLKVAGILTEFIEKDGVKFLIIGVGVNFSTKNFPDGLKNLAGAIDTKKISKEKLTEKMVKKILKIYKSKNRKKIVEKYKKYSYLLKKRVFFFQMGKMVEGTAIDINGDGNLVVKFDDGNITVLNSGEVSVRLEKWKF